MRTSAISSERISSCTQRGTISASKLLTWFIHSCEQTLLVPEASEKRVLSYFDDLFCFAKHATLEKCWLRMTKLVVLKTSEKFNRRLFMVYLGFECCSVQESERRAIAVKFSTEIRGRMLEA